jgi:hypothetical protein
MGKNAKFTGQPVFSQLLKYLPREEINTLSRKMGCEHYIKHFGAYDHLVSMLYSTFHNCRSLREVVTGMMACASRLNHLGLIDAPRRSTLADANKRRDSAVFEQIFYMLFKRYGKLLSDSRMKGRIDNRLFIVDSTSITLFQEVLKGGYNSRMNGKRKGGLKAHVLIRADQDVPCLVRTSAASERDSPFMKDIHLPKGSVLVFDRGYRNYAEYDRFDRQGTTWVTRKNVQSSMEVTAQLAVDDQQALAGVLKDELIILGNTANKKQVRIHARQITYKDKASGKIFEFFTNNATMKPSTIAQLYERRWQIEILFKRLKQNNQLRYFLGDNPNAVEIQVWCAIIADLITRIIQCKVKRAWSFANLSSMLRIHLMTYTNLLEFLENPEKLNSPQSNQLDLFSSV